MLADLADLANLATTAPANVFDDIPQGLTYPVPQPVT